MKKFVKEFLKEWWYLLFFFIFLVLLKTFVFSNIKVDGPSMDPTLEHKERMVMLKFGKIKRFDIVVSKEPDNPKIKIIKRVIGLPKDTVTYDHDQLYINGKKYNEPYLEEYKKLWKKDKLQETYDYNSFFQARAQRAEAFTVDENWETKFTIKVPRAHYLLMGDNRLASKDSRDSAVGPASFSDIQGKVKLAFWPPKRFGLIKDY
ncbi:MAG: signal peptidase I [Streptococcaceae bacterium]|jgi:signal peptidase I|nr:signal peptidase I [Streptococcaceae bacterium]